MARHKRQHAGKYRIRQTLATTVLGMMGFASALAAAPISSSATTPGLPLITDNHKSFLSRLARRTLRDSMLGRDEYNPDYVPEALARTEMEVVVRVWHDGFLLATGFGRRGPIANATSDAARGAGVALQSASPDGEVLRRLAVEIEAAADPVAIEVAADWTQPGALEGRVEPGVHGLVLIGIPGEGGAGGAPPTARRVYPSEFIRTDLPMDQALAGLARMMHMMPADLERTRLERFRTVHWYEPESGAKIVSLQRGLVLLPPESVQRNRLRQAAEQIAEYMAYRQLKSGMFTYRFDAGANEYSDENSLLSQAGAAAAVSYYARESGRSAMLAASDSAIRYHLQGLTDIPDAPGEAGIKGAVPLDAAFIASADGEHKLGLTALVCLALAEHPEPNRYASMRKKLANGILWLQRPSGMFLTAFPPAVRIDAQDFFPGEALLALAAEYALDPRPEILTAFDRAIEFYRDYFRTRGAPGNSESERASPAAFVPWQVQAFARMAVLTNRTDFAEYVFELTDWLVQRQLDDTNCPWPELHGGVVDRNTGGPSVSTALHLQALSDALILARGGGQADDQGSNGAGRAARYEHAVRAAARFVMQLQVRPEEAYFVRSPRDVIGGMREGPELNRFGIANCQYALIGLTKAQRALDTAAN